jgi:UDP-2-acetamido-3-amino-2,3-dideoxy-glucuronate N-acetyltransferase
MSALSPKFAAVPENVDERGSVRIFELDKALPFVPVRTFVISNVPKGKTRAGHFLTCDQVLSVLRGACQVTAKMGNMQEQHRLTPAAGALCIRRGTWLLLTEFVDEAIVLVFASERFDPTRDLPGRTNDWQGP